MKIYRTVDGKLVRGVEVSQSRRRIASANRDEMNRRWEMWENLSEEKKQVLLDDYDVKNETDLEKALEMCDDSYLIEDSEDTYDIYSGCHGKSKKLVKSSGYLADPTDLAYEACEYFKGKKPSKIAVAHWMADKFGYERGKPTDTDFVDTLDSLMMEYPYAYDEYHKDTPDDEYVDFYDAEEEVLSGCHGKSDKRRREKKEDELESSRNAVTFSKFNRISSLFIKNDRLVEGEECVIQIKDKNGRWEDVSYDREKPYWSIKGKPKMFSDEKTARKSALMKALNDAGYSEEAGNLQISMS
jgi:hypothetical protein